MTDYCACRVTQEMWEKAQDALVAVLPLIEANVPRLSTAGTAISLRDQVKAAIHACGVPCAEPQGAHHE